MYRRVAAGQVFAAPRSQDRRAESIQPDEIKRSSHHKRSQFEGFRPVAGYLCARQPASPVQLFPFEPSDPTMDGAPVQPARIPAHLRGLWVALAAGAVVCLGIAATDLVVDAYSSNHVDLGESILQTGRLPISTQTVAGYCWINDAPLTQVLMAMTARMGGTVALSIATCGAAALVLLATMIAMRFDRVGWLAAWVMVTWAAIFVATATHAGSEMASMVCFAALILLLQFTFAGWRNRWHSSGWDRPAVDRSGAMLNPLGYSSGRLRLLWLVGVIFFLWANLDGQFLAGLVIVWAYLAGRILEAFVRRGRAASGLCRRLALMGCLAGVASLINPYGPWLHAWLTDPVTLGHRQALHGVDIPIVASSLFPSWLALVGFGVVVMLVVPRRFDWAQASALVAAGVLSYSAASHAVLLGIAAAVWLARPLEDCLVLVRPGVLRWSRLVQGPQKTRTGARGLSWPNLSKTSVPCESIDRLPWRVALASF